MVVQQVKNLPAMQEMQIQSLFQKDTSNILAWEIPWIEEPCGLQSMYSPWGCNKSDIAEHTRTHIASRTEEAPLLTISPVY